MRMLADSDIFTINEKIVSKFDVHDYLVIVKPPLLLNKQYMDVAKGSQYRVLMSRRILRSSHPKPKDLLHNKEHYRLQIFVDSWLHGHLHTCAYKL